MRRFPLSYLALCVVSVLSVFALVHFGNEIFPSTNSAPSAHVTEVATKSSQIFLTLCSLLVVIVVTRTLGSLFFLLKQPRVIGEVVGGIVLGPSVLGMLAPGLMAVILPTSAVPFLSVISQIGILMFMFLVGLELDLPGLKRSGRAALVISHASIILPFVLGMTLALLLFREFAPTGTSFQSFSLFIGVSLSVTAFPVLARILSDSGMNKTNLGMLALTCAAIDDATAWCLLALVVGLLQSSVGGAIATMILTALYILFMIFLARPLMAKIVPMLERSQEQISEASLAFILICLLVSAVATEFIGIHALFGGFLLGAIIPHHSHLAKDLKMRLDDLVRVFFLPAFFAFTGLRTQIGLLESKNDWLICAGIIVVATVGKFGGAYLAARWSGLSNREASILGVLMNTRGLVELIVLNAGLDFGVLTPKLFTMFVIMAVVTTFATGPLLRLLHVQSTEIDPGRVLNFQRPS